MTDTTNQKPATDVTIPVAPFDPLNPLPPSLPAKNTLSPVFVQVKGDFLHGILKQESVEAVAKMYADYQKRIETLVETALKGNDDPKLREAAKAYAIAASRTRKEVTPKQLTAKLEAGADKLATETTAMLQELTMMEETLKTRLKTKKSAYGDRDEDPQGDHPFSGLLRGLQSLAVKFGFASPPTREVPWPAAVTENAPAATTAETPKSDTPQPVKVEADRIYYRLEDFSKSPVEPLVAEFLKEKGYTVTDYADGYAVDQRKNKCKIGKLLKEANPGLYEAFCEDSTRMGKNLLVVITKSYEDLARASYGRGWQSCRANAHSAVDYAVKEINIGVMAAYLIRETDPDINDPLGRVNIKPYDDKQRSSWSYDEDQPKKDDKNKKTVYFTFNPIGLHHPGFVNAVNRFVEEQLNGDKYGQFYLRPGCESYREFDSRTRLPMDAEAAFKLLGVKYAKDDEGKITVKGDLDLSGKGLSRLPDMRDVVVEGGINLSQNKLMTLEGLPTAPIKWLDVSSNLIGCFAGAPADVGKKLNYKDNCYLVTTYGAPKADVYEYGNGHQRSGRYGTGDKPVGPVEEPERFPSFKRKN